MSKIKRVYSFGNRTAEGKAEMKNLLGGKGANLAEMCSLACRYLPVSQSPLMYARSITRTTSSCLQNSCLRYGKR